jgi:hypothetical protein
MNGGENQQTPRVKIFWGILLLFLTPVLLFVKPVTKAAVLRDLLLAYDLVGLHTLALGCRYERSGPTDSK